MKKLAGFPYLVNSKEFKCFSRPQGDIGKQLAALPKPMIPEVVDRFRESLKIEDHMYNPLQKDKLDLNCKQF